MKSWKKCIYTASLFAMFAVVSAHLAKSAEETKAAPDTRVQVKIDNFAFTPMELTVAAGTTVEWVNRDDIPHVVVSDDKKTFKSKALDTDDRFSFTFTKPGTYAYFCSVHPKMTGKVVVQ
jgi:plastocyanin